MKCIFFGEPLIIVPYNWLWTWQMLFLIWPIRCMNHNFKKYVIELGFYVLSLNKAGILNVGHTGENSFFFPI